MPRDKQLSDTATRYVQERRKRREFSLETTRTVRSILSRFVAIVGDRPVNTISKRHVRKWWSTLNVGASSTRHQLSTVRTFLRWCVDEGLLRSDPTIGIRPPKEPRRVPRTIDAPKAARLVTHLPDTRARLMVLFMLHLGLRCGEVARMQVGDIDRDARLLMVRGKGGHQRVLPIPAEAWHALSNYLAEFPASSGPLVRRFDKPYDPLAAQTVSTLVRVWMSDAGVKMSPLDGVSGHALRRTCASDLLDAGATIREVQDVLGHRVLTSTEHYLRRVEGANLRPVLEGRRYASVTLNRGTPVPM